MRKKALLLCCLLLGTAIIPAFSDIKTDFDKVVDFSIKLSDLDNLAASTSGISPLEGKLVILNGAISSLEVVQEKPESFLAELTLVNGEWVDMSRVESYSCIVQLKGPAFAERIPSRRSRSKPDNAIEANAHVLVVGKLVGLRGKEGEKKIAVIEALYLRNIE